MNNTELIKAIKQLEEEKSLSKDVLIEAIEAALLSAYKKNFGSAAQNIRVELDRETGEQHVFSVRTIVESVADPNTEIPMAEARGWDAEVQVGDTVEVEVTPKDFGRIAAQTAKQVIVQRIREAERDVVYKEFRDREGDIVTGTVQRVERRNVYMDLGRIEAVLPPTEQVPREGYRQNDRVKAYVVEVKQGNRGPQIVVSRTHPGLLKRLFEIEVPEIYEGIVEIKAIAREAGARSKVAVISRDRNVDAVGSCVGPKGSRVQSIVDELRGEKIDIVPWASDSAIFVASALSPAKVIRVEISEETKTALVIVPDNQLSLAIGKEGQNARLAAKLTGWRIDIKSESQIKELEARKIFADLPAEEEPVTPEDGVTTPAADAPAPEGAIPAGGDAPVVESVARVEEKTPVGGDAPVVESVAPVEGETPVGGDAPVVESIARVEEKTVAE
ncbi:MAG TPA: transcription termination factor NusA [bacterium]|nr:transcription termination factor NusA [bacterium]